MDDGKATYYSLVQYVPDPGRGERINIGVIVTDDAGAVATARFLRTWNRAKRFAREDIRFLQDFAKAVQEEVGPQVPLLSDTGRWDLDRLRKFSLEWNNSIQISQPKASTVGVADLADEAYERFVKEPAAETRKFRDKRIAAGLATRALRRAVQDRYKRLDAGTVVRKTRLQGEYEEHEFDVGIQNHKALVAAEGLSFEVPETAELLRDVDALAFAIEDVLRALPSVQMGVVALPPKRRSARYDNAQRMYSGIGAQFVPADDVEGWAERTVAKLPSRL